MVSKPIFFEARDRWLYSTFPKFSTKTRGHKAPEIVQPPHTIQPRGRCDIEIGPHLFPDTVLYEVNYLSSEVPSTSSAPISNTPSNPHWQSTSPYGYSYQYSTPGSAPQANSSPAQPHVPAGNTSTPSGNTPAQSERVPTPLITSLSAVSIITPSLISQVNAAAAADPIFSNLLQLAAAKTATEDQLQTLGLLIQSLAAIDHAKKIAAAASLQTPVSSVLPVNYNQPSPVQTPSKPFDLVIEFRETPCDRWLFSRGTVCAERLPTPNSVINGDILITMCLSNDGKVCVKLDERVNKETAPGSSGLYTATLRLKEPPPHIWDMLIRWIGGDEKNALCKKQLQDLVFHSIFFLRCCGVLYIPGSAKETLSGPSTPIWSISKPTSSGNLLHSQYRYLY